MDWAEIQQILVRALNLTIPLIAGLIGGSIVMLQARKRLSKRDFLDRVNFSLNIIQHGRLHLRTIIEKPATEVFLNPAIIKKVSRASKKTTANDPLLPIGKKNDYWLCLNAALNEVSEKFAHGYIRQDITGDARTETYVLCLTCEVSDHMNTRKVRVMMIKKSLLEYFPTADPKVDAVTHATRIRTLRQLSEAYSSGQREECFMEFELSV